MGLLHSSEIITIIFFFFFLALAEWLNQGGSMLPAASPGEGGAWQSKHMDICIRFPE